MTDHRVNHSSFIALALSLASLAALAACATGAGTSSAPGASGASASRTPVAVRDGFVAPEAVRYDPDQDVYFVANWGGDGNPGKADNNGYISRMRPDGTIENLRFIAGGTNGVTLHSPRGMYIVGDTLWAADFDAVRGFNRRTGAPLASIDFSSIDRDFLNDLAADATGTLYITDTGKNKLYRVQGGPTLVVSDSALGAPNGITWDAANRRFLILPYGGAHAVRAWTPGTTTLTDVGTSSGSKFDGIEVLSGGQLLVSSQADSSIHLFVGGKGRPIIHASGPPADIAVDTRRNRVAIPIVSLNRVEIWDLPR
jgi:sugar lactone lactonase YvrE